MSEMLSLPVVLAGIMVVALNAYVLFGGADFGGGVWDLLARGPRRDAQRALIADAIGPVWEANHVWLILVVVLLFTCFPPAFAELGIALHIPISLMLIGIVMRGSAFTFRTYDTGPRGKQRQWGRIFAIASVGTPLLLGMLIGAIASGRMREPHAGTFAEVYIAPWLTPFALAVGAMTLALCAFLAAVYLTVEARDVGLAEDFRRRALGAAAAVFVTAFAALLLSHAGAPLIIRGLIGSPWAAVLHVVTGIAAVGAIVALWTRRYNLARIAAGAQVSLILWGWAFAQYPYLVPPRLAISDAAAPAVTLRLILIALIAGAFVLVPSLWYLIRIFKAQGRPEAFEPVEKRGTT